jgi:hypothetical protein
MGVCIEPPEYVIGLEHFETWVHRTRPEGVRSEAGDLDFVVNSLRKYARLALRGNPTVLLLLFVIRTTYCCERPSATSCRHSRQPSFRAAPGIRSWATSAPRSSALLGECGQKHVKRGHAAARTPRGDIARALLLGEGEYG